MSDVKPFEVDFGLDREDALDQLRELEARHSELVKAAREVGLLREEFKISSALRSGRNPNEIQKEFLVKLDELAKLAEVK